MPEIPISDLDPRVRKQFESAKLAIERGNFGYTVEICSSLLEKEPGCLEARKLLRRAQQCIFGEAGKGVGGRLASGMKARTLLVYGKPYLKKKPALAMAYAERALVEDPFSKTALSLVAAGAEALELHETTVFCLKSICDRDTNDPAILQRYCEALIHTGDTDQAIRIAERLSRVKPDDSSIQELVKSASVAHSINRGKWAEEERDFRSKLKDGDLAEAIERENRIAVDETETNQQTRELIDAIHQDPQNLDLYKRLVRSFLAAEDYRNALLWLDKAAALPQAEADLTLKQTRSEITIKSTEEEIEKLRADLAESSGPSERVSKRIQILEKELNFLKIDEARKIVEQFPNDYAQRLRYGELLLEFDQIDEAVMQFQVSQRSSSLKQKSCVLLGRSFFRKGLYDLALAQFDRSIEGVPSMDDFKKDVLYASAECCELLGNTDEAIRRYKLIYSSDIGFRDVAAKIDGFYSQEK